MHLEKQQTRRIKAAIMDIHNLTAKERKKIHTWLRALIQLLYFIFIPSVYTAAFAGVKYIFTQIGAGEKVAMTSFVTVLLVICLYTLADSSAGLPARLARLETHCMRCIQKHAKNGKRNR